MEMAGDMGREEALRDSNDHFKEIFESAATGLAIIAVDGRYIWANRAYLSLLGYTKEELLERDVLSVTHPEDREKNGELLKRLLSGEREGFVIEKRYWTKAGGIVWVRNSVSARWNSVGEPISVVAVSEDITQQKMAEEEVRQQQALLNIAARMGNLGGWIVSIPDSCMIWSDQVRVIHGAPAGFTPSAEEGIEFYAPECRDVIRKAFEACVRDGTPYDLQLQIVTLGGRRVWVRTMAEAIRDDLGRIIAVQGAFQDISSRKQTEAALKRSEERFRMAAEATSDVVWDWNLIDGSIWSSDGLQRLFGHDPAAMSSNIDLWAAQAHPDDRQRVLDGIQDALGSAGKSWSDEYRFMRADGSYAEVISRGSISRDGDGAAVRMIGCMVDATKQRNLEEQLRRSQRLEAIGRLTGGIAHDFNNLLTVVIGNAETLTEKLVDDEELGPLAEMTLDAAGRGADLIDRLLAFARRQPLDPKTTNVNELLSSLDRLLRRVLGEHVEIEAIHGGGLWPAFADVPQLESAIVNLCINARDAMPSGGKLTIETANSHLDADYADQRVDVVPGQYIMIAVSDTGVGMDQETLSHAFEPFFTTKRVGQGTGLGLSMVFGFAKQSNGHVSIYSEPGQGTTVRLYLPRAPADADQTNLAIPSILNEPGAGRILLVEDDDLVRRHVEGQINGLGYDVVSAANAKDALDLLGNEGPFDLLFTDVVMPGGMSGPELAKAAQEVQQGIRILFTSGYTENAIVHHGRLDRGIHLLAKPYRRQDLVAKLRAVMVNDPVDGAKPAPRHDFTR